MILKGTLVHDQHQVTIQETASGRRQKARATGIPGNASRLVANAKSPACALRSPRSPLDQRVSHSTGTRTGRAAAASTDPNRTQNCKFTQQPTAQLQANVADSPRQTGASALWRGRVRPRFGRPSETRGRPTGCACRTVDDSAVSTGSCIRLLIQAVHLKRSRHGPPQKLVEYRIGHFKIMQHLALSASSSTILYRSMLFIN